MMHDLSLLNHIEVRRIESINWPGEIEPKTLQNHKQSLRMMFRGRNGTLPLHRCITR